MTKFLFVTHGHMATGVKSTLEIITGNCSKLTAIDAYVDSKNVVVAVKEYFDQLLDDEQLIMLSDIENGSANQLLYKYLSRPKTFLITGVNLPLLLQIILNDNLELTENDLKKAIEEAKNSIKLFKDYGIDDDDEGSFF